MKSQYKNDLTQPVVRRFRLYFWKILQEGQRILRVEFQLLRLRQINGEQDFVNIPQTGVFN
jgi:hypothetical protein